MMISPNPTCEKECRFVNGPMFTTSMYFPPVYDKHGNNVNPDGNSSSGKVKCVICNRQWMMNEQYGQTTYEEIE